MGRHSANKGDKPGRSSERSASPLPSRRAKRADNALGAKRAKSSQAVTTSALDSTNSPKNLHQEIDNSSRRTGSLESAPKRLRSELERRKSRNKRIAATISLGILALFAVLAVGGFAYYKSLEGKLQTGIESKEKLNLGLKKAEPKKPYNMLIMGYDKRKGETSFRTDSMMLTRIDPEQKKVWIISLPRDYKVQIPGHGTRKLNAAYAFGKETLAISTIEKLTGQKINHYMGVDFKGFKAIVESVGGVEIDVPYKINDPKADYTHDKSATKIDKGLQTLNGAQALTFVRTRDFPDGDFSRMRNQQLFFSALADTVAKNVSTTELPGVAKAIVPYLSTDMSLIQLYALANDMRGAGSSNIYTTSLPGEWKSPYIVPDEKGKTEILRKFAEGIPFNMSVEEESAAAVTAELKPSLVQVTVRNGTSRVGVAKQAASVLKTRGFIVGEVGNTQNQSVYDETLLVYKTSKTSAQLAAKYIQPGVKLVESRGMYAYDTEVMLIIGKDWDIEKLPVADVSGN